MLAPISIGGWKGRSEVAFIPRDIQDPVEIKGDANERIWKVNLVANLVYRATSDSIEKVVPFNKTISCHAWSRLNFLSTA